LSSHQQAAAMQNPPAIKDDIASTKTVQVWIVIRKTIYYFFFLDFALRWTLYAMARACLIGLPDLISVFKLRVKQFCEAHFRSGIILFFFYFSD
jgi:hypothetical protein